MSIDAVGSSSSLASLTSTQQTRRHHGGPPLNDTAALLGTNADDLQTQLKSGTTLQDIAKQKGVSQDDLLNAIKSDLKSGKPEGAPDLDDSQLTNMASAIASGQRPQGPGGPGGHGHGHGGPPPVARTSDSDADDSTVNQNLTSLADALGTNPDELRTLLSSVQDLGSLLEKSGVTGYGSAGTSAATAGLAVDEYA